MKSPHDTDGVLERNVSTLLETGGEPPRLDDAVRTRIRAHLLDQHGAPVVTRARSRRPRRAVAVGLGLAAAAVAAVIVTSGGGAPAPRPDGALADGSTWVVAPGGTVEVIAPRRVRVTGAALLDVAPGAGTFVVETARGRIEVLGTRFLVDAGAARTTAAVVRGQVKLASTDGEVLLHAGEQGVAEPGRPPTRGPAPRLSHLVSWAAQARKRDEHAVKPLRNGTLFARDPNAPWVPETPLPIAKLAVDVVVEDRVARVALDQSFHNPAASVREGMYRFAIPPDASLQRLAMYVNGERMEAAVVERMHARRIYEDIVYRRLDPALLEWAGTGRLALRVYPLPPREDKRVVLAYTQSLPKLYDDWTLSVPLPEVDLPVGELAFDVKLAGCANCEVTSPSHRIDVRRAGEDAIARYRGTGVALGDSLVLRVRDRRAAPVVAAHARGDDRFVMVRAKPELGARARTYRPRTWVILDDVSASRGPLELRAQAALVDAFVRELDEEDRVAVVAFDVTARTKLAPTRVIDVDRQALRRALANEGGVGATSFAAALATATQLLAGTPAADARIVYLGDGVITTGAKNLDELRAQLAGKAQFIGVGVGDGPDTQTLEALAAATGGYATLIDLADDLGWRAFDLVAALHTPRVTGLDATLVDAAGTPVPATLYLRAQQLADGEELELVAKLAGGAPPVAALVTGTLDGAPWQQRIELAGASTDAGYLPRLWAQQHIAARLLAKHAPVIVPPCAAPPPQTRAGAAPPACATEAELRAARDEAIRQEVVALGKQYFLLSRHTSLLVLEDDAMYAKYGVTKGAGDTWAPYALPAKIPVAPRAHVATNVADDAELVRTPLQVFHGGDVFALGNEVGGGAVFAERDGLRGGVVTTRATLGLVDRVQAGPPAITQAPTTPSLDAVSTAGDLRARREAAKVDEDRSEAQQQIITTTEALGGEDLPVTGANRLGTIGAGTLGTLGFGSGRGGRWSGGGGLGVGWSGGLHAQRLTYPTDTAYDDLTAFVPALFPDASDAIRSELRAAAGAATTHPIDAAAKALLERARRAVPAGVYRWGDREIAVDAARRIGWRRTTGADLVETASFDGRAWTRRYAELGLDVVRPLAEDDVAFALAYLPLWIAEPAHYARWFEVRARGREVELVRAATTPAGTPRLAYVLVFDAAHRLVAIRDGAGRELVGITWGAAGPTAARIDGAALDVGFTAQAIADAPAWAHGGSRPGVLVELPGHLPAYWAARLAALPAGGAEWRHAQRQHMVSLAALGDRTPLFAAYAALRDHGGVELGDLVLASGGVATASTDAQLGPALAPLRDTAVARYLAAGRAYGKAPAPARLRAQVEAGHVGALWTLRESVALVAAQQGTRAADRLLALGARAFDLRLIGAAALGQHYQTGAADVIRAWEAVATGDARNVARAQAAQHLANRGAYDAAAARIAALVDDLDLRAAPPALANVQWAFHSSRRGQAGWHLVWARWRDRVLAGDRFDHVVALMALAAPYPGDVPAILARAAELARGDGDRVAQVARLAANAGQPALAQRLITPLVQAHPTRALHQLAAELALRQGQHADALAHLEAAQAAAADEAVALATVRQELGAILQVARQVALLASGPARTAAVERALAWAARWRAIDPGNPQIDQQAGELLLAIGDTAGAWRQLSGVIERDPMAGDGYAIVADAFERQGRVAEALAYWHEAVVIDQTNPTHRLREAQALIALGRTGDGDAILEDIARRRWHVRWDGIVYQARQLLAQAKRQHVK